MTTPELIALSLGLSVVLATLGYGLVRLIERGVADPVLRERAWAAALYIPVLPVLMVAILLTGPRPVVEAAAVIGAVTLSPVLVGETARVPMIETDQLALAGLGLAVLLGLARGIGLTRRAIRLRRLVGDALPAKAEVLEPIRTAARRIAVSMPQVCLCASSGEAMVTGFFRPVLILPDALAADRASRALRNICAHELTHLKRGDHLALWIEEVVLTVLAVNPLLRAIRDRRAAAREEACDMQVLAHADGDERRLYARALLDALRVAPEKDVPALTFTSNRRIFVMRRLNAILSPAPTAGVRPRAAVLGLGVALAAGAGVGSVALADQREPEVVTRPAPVSVERALPAPRATATRTRTTPVAAPAIVAPAPKVEPAPIVAEVITNPQWAQMPMPRSYPAAALEQGLTNGRADLSCTVQADGRVSACTIVSEDPVGAGYGAAALDAAASARLAPRSLEGNAVGGTVRFTVRFVMDPR